MQHFSINAQALNSQSTVFIFGAKIQTEFWKFKDFKFNF